MTPKFGKLRRSIAWGQDARFALFMLLVLLLLPGCGGKSVAVSTDGAAVFRDAQDGHLDRKWSCGSLLAALARYSPTALNFVGAQVAAGRTCDGALNKIKNGTRETAVRGSMGEPLSVNSSRGNGCWFYTWPSNLASPEAGWARICFKDGAVSLVQRHLAPLN